MTRLAGWESRLEAVIEAARQEPFKWGAHDCYRLACEAVEALTGVDHWQEFLGLYSTQREARRIIASFGPTFPEFVSNRFGESVDVRLARRGDLMMLTRRGMPALGVCVGSETAVRFEHELGFLRRGLFAMAWQVG